MSATAPRPNPAESTGQAVHIRLAGFARALRAAGLPVDADRSRAFVQACAAAGVADRAAVFWAARVTLCSDPGQFPVHDAVFAAWFDGRLPRPVGGGGAVRLGLEGAGAGGAGEEPGEAARARASDADVLRSRDVATLDAAERAALAQLFATVRPRPPTRATARRRPARTGDPDPRRTLREQLRRGGEPVPVRRRRPARRPRRVVLLVDVSGSMSPYADALLRLAHVWVRAAPRTTEVFTLGTRLTRVTPPLRERDAEAALRGAGAAVPDWSGGTRLGETLRAFLRVGRERARGAVVVVFSDGWERGGPDLLGEQAARLRRLAYRVVWVSPHRGKAGYRPVQGGVAAVLPHVDHLVAGHSLDAFADLAALVARA